MSNFYVVYFRMHLLTYSLILSLITVNSEKLIDNLLLFTHSNSPSHLTVVFDVAERLNDSKNVYDIRFPMVDSVANHKPRKGFKLYSFDDAMKYSKKVQEMVDKMAMEKSGNSFAILEMVATVFETILLPCRLEHRINFQSGVNNVALADPFSGQCLLPYAKTINSRLIYVSPLMEPATISLLSGAPLTSYTMSVFQADPNPYFHVRIANVFSNLFFRLFTFQLSIGKWWYNQHDNTDLFEDPDPTLVLINSHKYLDYPFPRVHNLIDIGNINPKPMKKLDVVSLQLSIQSAQTHAMIFIRK